MASAASLALVLTVVSMSPNVTVKNGLFHVDDKPFMIIGVGYEPGAWPGMVPWNRTFEPERITRDLERIKAAGFNTIRTWAPMTDEEIDLVQKAGLRIIMGIWLNKDGPWTEAVRDQSLAILRADIPRLKKWNCILGYVIMNEPLADAIVQDIPAFEQFHRDMLAEIRRLGETRPVSYAATMVDDFMPLPFYDFAAFNLYPYNPVTVSDVLGYQRTVEWLKRDFAGERPLVLTEYGLSVSPNGPGGFGYGGNTLDEQRDGVLMMTNALLRGGGAGYCVFGWADGWWKNHEKPQDELTHDPDPEEWFGIMGIEGPLENPLDVLRPAYHALAERQNSAGWPPAAAPANQDTITFDPFPAAIARGALLSISGTVPGGASSVKIGIHDHENFSPGTSLTVPVDANGRFAASYTVGPTDNWLTISAAADGAWQAAMVGVER